MHGYAHKLMVLTSKSALFFKLNLKAAVFIFESLYCQIFVFGFFTWAHTSHLIGSQTHPIYLMVTGDSDTSAAYAGTSPAAGYASYSTPGTSQRYGGTCTGQRTRSQNLYCVQWSGHGVYWYTSCKYYSIMWCVCRSLCAFYILRSLYETVISHTFAKCAYIGRLLANW